MKNTLQSIIAVLIDHPDQMHISEENDNGITTYTIHIAKEDMGKVIGKEGKVIRSIRNVMKIPAMKHNQRINIALAEEEQA